MKHIVEFMSKDVSCNGDGVVELKESKHVAGNEMFSCKNQPSCSCEMR